MPLLRLAGATEKALHLLATLGNTIVEQVWMDDGDFFLIFRRIDEKIKE